ncbi:hypothetical protein BRADI_3g17956v3, partial [Brachypodium distachyon]
MAPVRREPGASQAMYGPSDSLFSVSISHGGFFCGFRANRSYNMGDVLRIVDRDADTLAMASVVPKFMVFSLYVDHKDELYSNLCLDDVCIVGSPPLPPVLNPRKPSMNNAQTSQAAKEKERLPDHNVMHRSRRNVEPADGDVDADGSSSDDIGSEWVDSDNEIGNDDDDLFDDWVDD